MSFSLYRVVHQTHHAYLTTERDQEFWPLSQPAIPRWERCVAAFFELNFGLFFTPFVFMRAFFRSASPVRSKRVRRRVWAELALTVVFWSSLLWAVAGFDLWKYFIWMYLAPAFLAANLAELAQIHRARRNDGRHGQRIDPQHRGQFVAGATGGVHALARTASWRSSSTRRIAALGVAPARGEIAAQTSGRTNAFSQLSSCFCRLDAQPGQPSRGAAVAGH